MVAAIKDGSVTYHSGLLNLLWSVAGHTIDTDLDINSNSVTNINNIDLTGKFIQQMGTLNPETPLHQYTPIITGFATANNYSESSAGNIFHSCSWVENDGSSPVVAVFGEGLATGVDSKSWGGNFVAYAKSSTAIAIAQEINFGVLTSGGQAYGTVYAAAGEYAAKNYVQMQSNNLAARPQDGIVFNGYGGFQPIQTDGTLILASKDPSVAFNVAVGIDLSNIGISTTAFAMPNNTNITAKDSGGTIRQICKIDGNNYLAIGDANGLAGIVFYPGVAEIARFTSTVLNMQTHKITNVVDPTANQEVATKKYVDDHPGSVLKAGIVTQNTDASGQMTITFAASFASVPVIVTQIEGNIDYYSVIISRAVDSFVVKILKTGHVHSQGNTGAGGAHAHSNPSTSVPSATHNLTTISSYDTKYAAGVAGGSPDYAFAAVTAVVNPSVGAGTHNHSQGNTGTASSHAHSNPSTNNTAAGNALASTSVTISYIAMIP